ncbi:MAG: permease [Patescibacteria group bacterium]|jgi:uncharacterized membrane protein YraQ (UPF0718 family)|nr:permease [Patescibacteria group bacterium]
MDIFYPLELFSKWITYDIFSLQTGHLAGALQFFVYDSLKIFVLIIFITHFMSLLRFYLPIEKLKDFLATHKLFGLDYFLATLFGALTPFCSCSSIPLFIGFMEARIPLGVTFAFLITSPLVNEIAIGLFIGMFGMKITIIYVTAGILIGMIGGFVIGKLKMEKYVADFVWNIKSQKLSKEDAKKIPWLKVYKIISREAWGISRKIMLYVLAGVAVGGLIHGYVPEGFFDVYLRKAGFWGVPLAVILAVPLYSNASGVIPIIQSLVAKGVPIGTGLAFMMATVGLSLPEAMILKKVLKWQLLATFFGIVSIGIIIIGYLFNSFIF